ncbi:hypothetical protein CTAYLR_000428 [Chrysophaeum taylorii]|uniref:Histone chaperone n=1 Tax=Chrysophaeum taylorii TaxID=2483200 RepID=A0AAD7XN59_9STRA|nr:hypothetical protein CTAYLR_000428 [Chrysophaeum taylorii]
MALVDIVSVKVSGENPAPFRTPLEFEITFECLESLEDDLEWKIVYVGSAGDESKDQTLEEVMVGPVPVGTSKFALQAEPPDIEQIPAVDRLGVTVVSITCSYRDQPFVSVGYYVNNEFYPQAGPGDGGVPEDPEEGGLDLSKIYRNLMANEPRVTRYSIKWTGPVPVPQPSAASPAAPRANDDDDEDDDEEEEDEDDEDEDDIQREDEVDLADDEEEDEEEDEEDEIDLEAEEPSAKRRKTTEAAAEEDDEGDEEEEEEEEEDAA